MLTILSEDNRVAVTYRQHLKSTSSDRVMLLECASFFTIRNDLIVQMRMYFDSFDALQQILGKDLTEIFVPSVRNALQRR